MGRKHTHTHTHSINIINDTLARSLEPVVTECKEHTIHTQTQVVASTNNGGFFPDIILKFSGTHGDRGTFFSLFS